MTAGYTYSKAQAKRFIKRTKTGLIKMFNSGYINSNKFMTMTNHLDNCLKKLK